MKQLRYVFPLIILFLLVGCATTPMSQHNGYSLQKASYQDLPGWKQDNQEYAYEALRLSCRKILNFRCDSEDPRCSSAWINSCEAIAQAKKPTTPRAMRALVEAHFTPYLVTVAGSNQGLFTGYYEPAIEGSLTKTAYYSVPLYSRPSGFKTNKRSDGSKYYTWRPKGSNAPEEAVPSRAKIEQKALADTPVLAWIHSPVDRYFMQVQGSGRIDLPNHKHMILGYAAQNGRPSYLIGKYLADIGAIPLKEINMESIRTWFDENPEQMIEALNHDPSFIFFRKLTVEQPLGTEGTPLTPGRSVAVDRSAIKMGTLMWIDTTYPPKPDPEGRNKPGAPLQRLVVAQDTGGAIKGPIRADVFWGSGSHAVFLAGHLQSRGQYWLLLPKDMSADLYQ